MTREREVVNATISLKDARSLQLEKTRVLAEALLVPVLMYGSEAMNGKQGETKIKDYECTYRKPLWFIGYTEDG